MTLAELHARLGLHKDATPWELDDAWKRLHRRLGVALGASRAELRKAKRRLSASRHPDGAERRGEDVEEASERYRLILEAFELLSDDKVCAAYAANAAGPLGAPGRPEAPGGAQDRAPQPRPPMAPGQDLEVLVELDLRVALRGGPHVFTVDLGAFGSRTITCELPQGAEPGLVICATGEGGFGAPSGNLRLVIQALVHPTWVLLELDILAPLPVTYAQLYEGRQVLVETPWETRAIWLRPADPRRVRIKGHGVRRGRQQGDMILTPMVTFPPPGDAELAHVLRRLQG